MEALRVRLGMTTPPAADKEESSVLEDAEGLLADAHCLVEFLEHHGVALDQNEIAVAATTDRDLIARWMLLLLETITNLSWTTVPVSF